MYFRILIIIAIGIYGSNSWSETICRVDADCAIIRTNCGCTVLTKSAAKLFEKPEILCRYNNCPEKDVTAICKNKKCLRSDGKANN